MWDRITNYSEGMVLRRVAYTEELLGRSDSTLALSCFDQSLRESAKAGEIFSDVASTFIASGPLDGLGIFQIGVGFFPGIGNITLDNMGGTLGYIVAPNLSAFVENFVGSLGFEIASLIGGTMSDLLGSLGLGDLLGGLLGDLFGGLFGGADFQCDSMGSIWRAVSTDGINLQAPFFTMDDFFDANIPGVGDEFLANLLNGTGPAVRADARDAIRTLLPGSVPYFPAVPSFGDDSREITVTIVLGNM